MKTAFPVELAGTGICVPSQVWTNEHFASYLDTSDEWIAKRTGIRERRIAAQGESTLTFALGAARQAMQRANVTPEQIDLIINATFTPEHPLPSTACELQAALGCRWIPAFDLVAACSGFVFGLTTAAHFLDSGMAGTALVIGTECMSPWMDMEDRATAVLFGDGAGAAVLRRSSNPGQQILAARMAADGGRAKLIWIPAGGTAEPASARTVNERLHYIRMQGREVYRFAVTQMQELIEQTLDDAGVSMDDVALLIPHQSNSRIIESACEKLNVPSDKVIINIDRYGNTSAASIPIALHEAWTDGRVQRGDLVLLVAFGAGLTWGSVLLRL